ncbi:hypothetical protein BJV82DRAFT_485216, partial [Fennellomyces sp. T-0311]
LNTEKATEIAQELICRYLEAVVMFGRYWILVTSLDCFFHSRKSLDDCADLSSKEYQRKAKTVMRQKTMLGRTYMEASMLIGNIELLVTGGLHGQEVQPVKYAFLGSSIK